MLGIRYEDYTRVSDGLPFVFAPEIERSCSNYSREANWHENPEIQICLDGQGYLLIDGKKHLFSEGDTAVMNSNVIHYTGTEEKITYACLIIDSAFCIEADINHTSLIFEECFKSKKIKALFQKLKNTYSNTEDVCRTAKLRRIVLSILIELREKHTIGINHTPQNRDSYGAIKNAIKYIRENYEKKLTLDIISKSVFIDKYTLSRNFKSVTGQTVVEYINTFRCRKAAELIRSGTTVSEAAVLCGYNNMSFFSKTFKQYMGELPHNVKNN